MCVCVGRHLGVSFAFSLCSIHLLLLRDTNFKWSFIAVLEGAGFTVRAVPLRTGCCALCQLSGFVSTHPETGSHRTSYILLLLSLGLRVGLLCKYLCVFVKESAIFVRKDPYCVFVCVCACAHQLDQDPLPWQVKHTLEFITITKGKRWK